MYEHHIRFQWLAYIAEQSSDKKGGALITAIHGFLQHGSVCAQEVFFIFFAFSIIYFEHLTGS